MFCLYHALIGSKTDCGSFVYGSAISPNCLTDHVHNTGIRLSTVAFSTSHMLNLHVEPLELPLSVHRIYAAGDPTQASNTQNSILSHGLWQVRVTHNSPLTCGYVPSQATTATWHSYPMSFPSDSHDFHIIYPNCDLWLSRNTRGITSIKHPPIHHWYFTELLSAYLDHTAVWSRYVDCFFKDQQAVLYIWRPGIFVSSP